MAPRQKKISLSTKKAGNRRRRQPHFAEAIRMAEARARVQANRPANRRHHKLVRASIAPTVEDETSAHWWQRLMRWMLAFALLPFCAVTTVTFFGEFSTMTLNHAFWRTSAFWYFATGVVLMLGWFASGLLWNVFLYLYVLGHELTHILFIRLFLGTVREWGVSVDGGYVTTDKSNIIIALAPYFVPLWAAVVVSGFALVGYFVDLSPVAVKTMYGLIGFFWAFHSVWTVWMIPRDQPDLRENGTFLSLIIIYLANIAVLVGLTCLASPDMGFRGFAYEWYDNAREMARGGLAIWRDLSRVQWW